MSTNKIKDKWTNQQIVKVSQHFSNEFHRSKKILHFLHSSTQISSKIIISNSKIQSGCDFGYPKNFSIDAIIAIGGGGFVPARMLRTYLKIPIFAVSMALYDAKDKFTGKLITTQWLDETSKEYLKGKRVLIVDEVDDSRTTLAFCCKNLLHTCELSGLGVAVLHNKKIEKQAELPKEVGENYFAGEEIPNLWIVYPWESLDPQEHDRLAKETVWDFQK